MGGLSKKAFQIKALTGKNVSERLLLDSGNLLFKQPTVIHGQEVVTALGLMDIYRKMSYDAVAVGPNDIAAGIELLKTHSNMDLPWLSANLRDKHNVPIFSPAKIVERGGLKIGIVGLTGPILTVSQELSLIDWRKALTEQLERLAKECSMIIVLSSLPAEDNAEITRSHPQVHLLITADRQQGNIVPRLENNTVVMQTMNQGKNLGVLNLNWIPGSSWEEALGQKEHILQDRIGALDRQILRAEKQQHNAPGNDQAKLQQIHENRRITFAQLQELKHQIAAGAGTRQKTSSFSSSFIFLTKNLPEDQEIAARVEKVKEEINQHNQRSIANNQQAWQKTSSEKLAGATRCQECHPTQTKFWKTTGHAKSYATLQQQRQNFNLDCLPCHVTLDAEQSSADTHQPEALLDLSPALQVVGCEVCHGPGRAHADNPEKVRPNKNVDMEICQSCHTKERDLLFHYEKKIGKVSCSVNL